MYTNFSARVCFSKTNISLMLIAAMLAVPALAAAGGVHPMFNVQSSTQSPFPSNSFTVRDHLQRTGLRVSLPMPDCSTHPSDCADVTLLNQLDGFNLQPRLSIPFDGAIDLSTVSSKTIFLVKLSGKGRRESEFEHARPEVVGINQIVWDPATLTLFAESDDHLDQDSSYILLVTTGVHDSAGNPIEVARDFRGLRGDDDSDRRHEHQAGEYLESLNHALDEAEEALERLGVSRRRVAAASVFTTESVTSTLESIHAQIRRAPAPAVSFALGASGEKTVFPLNQVSAISFQPQVLVTGPKPNNNLPIAALQVVPGAIGTVAFGKFNAANWENSDGFIPATPTRRNVPVQSTEDLYFNLFIPAGTAPSTGWPVAIFGHGFGDSKQGGVLAVASVMASQGIATIAINVVGHGFGPQGTLTVVQNGKPVVFLAGGRGVDQDGNGQITSTEGSSTSIFGPQVSIGSRDALQQTVADLMQLVRAIQGGVDVNGDGLPDLDGNRIYYFGQSFGGIYGTIFMGAEPDVHAGVPNVPGGSIIDIVRMGGFRPLLGAILLARVPALENMPFVANVFPFNDNKPLRNEASLVNTVPGSIAIQTVEDVASWLGQAGDPVAWAPFIRKSPLPGSRAKSVIIQFARGDQTVPNPTATALVRSGDLADRATFFRNDIAAPLGVGFGNPHAFLTAVNRFAAIEAQLQIAVFLSTDGAQMLDPDSFGPMLGVPASLPPLFETPIAGPLPEDLGFVHTFPLP